MRRECESEGPGANKPTAWKYRVITLVSLMITYYVYYALKSLWKWSESRLFDVRVFQDLSMIFFSRLDQAAPHSPFATQAPAGSPFADGGLVVIEGATGSWERAVKVVRAKQFHGFRRELGDSEVDRSRSSRAVPMFPKGLVPIPCNQTTSKGSQR